MTCGLITPSRKLYKQTDFQLYINHEYDDERDPKV